MAKITLNHNQWKNYAKNWKPLKPPERPSSQEIKLYEKWARKKAGGKAIIYGATPELRDLLAKYNFDVTLVDREPNMIRAMQELIKISKGDEKIIIANWLKVPLKSHQYDLILCDHGLHHIAFNDWPIFLTEAERLLKPNGYLTTNIITMPASDTATISEMVKVYKKNQKKFNRQDMWYYHYRIFWGLKDYGKQKYMKNLTILNDQLKQLLKQKVINNQDYKILASPWEGWKCCCPLSKDVDKMLEKYFKILSKKSPQIKNNALIFHHIYNLTPKI
ncbi:MAG: class I SAM-dependent methyltransferase [Patescibacteria group bacterium]|nr:class I SAM-dependent methyltransferase [Patescibacteria group bacterium]